MRGSVARVGAPAPGAGSCYRCAVYEALLLILVGAGAVVWFAVKAGREGPRQVDWEATTARIADVTVFDEGEAEHARTMYRVVLVFTTSEGEAVAVDWTGSPSPTEKDLLLPDAIVPLRYDPRRPDHFELGRLPRPGDPPLPEPPAPRADARRVYSPRR